MQCHYLWTLFHCLCHSFGTMSDTVFGPQISVSLFLNQHSLTCPLDSKMVYPCLLLLGYLSHPQSWFSIDTRPKLPGLPGDPSARRHPRFCFDSSILVDKVAISLGFLSICDFLVYFNCLISDYVSYCSMFFLYFLFIILYHYFTGNLE